MDNEKLIEEMARGIDAVDMFSRFNDWTGDHVPGLPIEICRNTEDDDIEVVARYSGRNEKDGDEHLARHIKDARAQAALAAIEAAGFMVVPKEPTEAMVSAADDLPDWCSYCGRPNATQAYRAMIAAAPNAGRG